MRKLFSLITLITFTANTLAWSAPSPGLSVGVSQPLEIVHIQDAHSNYEAQKSIRGILKNLHEQEGFNFIALEGAWQPLYPKAYHFFPDAGSNLKTADFLAQKGEMSGGEMYALELSLSPAFAQQRERSGGEGAIVFEGVEDEPVFRENYELFKKGLLAQEEVKSYFEKVYSDLDREKSRAYSPEFLKFDRQTRKLAVTPAFLRALEKSAREKLKLELTHPLNQREWPYLCRMLRVMNAAQGLDMEAVKKDAEKLARSSEFTRSLIANKFATTNPRQFFENLYAESLEKNISLDGCKALRKYSEHLILQSELSGPELFAEMNKLIEQLENVYAKSIREQELLKSSRETRLMEKLMTFEATSEDWGIVRSSDFSRYENNERINSLLQTVRSFYALAESRNAILLNNTLAKMKSRGVKKAVLITGGFHAQGIESLARQKNISYRAIQPQILEEFGNQKYIDAVLGESKIPKPLGMVKNPYDPQEQAEIIQIAMVHAASLGDARSREYRRRAGEGADAEQWLRALRDATRTQGFNLTLEEAVDMRAYAEALEAEAQKAGRPVDETVLDAWPMLNRRISEIYDWRNRNAIRDVGEIAAVEGSPSITFARNSRAGFIRWGEGQVLHRFNSRRTGDNHPLYFGNDHVVLPAPVGTKALVYDDRERVTVRDLSGERPREIAEIGRSEHLTWSNSAFSADGRFAAVIDDMRTLKIIELETGKVIHEIKNIREDRHLNQINANGSRVIMTDKEGVYLLSTITGENLLNLPIHSRFTSDGEKIFKAGPSFQVWNALDGALVRSLRLPRGSGYGILNSYEGLVLMNSREGALLWDIGAEGESPYKILRHESPVNVTIFTPNGELALTGTQDGFIHVWDTRTGSEVYQFNPHAGSVQAIYISPDGSSFIVRGEEGHPIRLFHIDPKPELRSLHGRIYGVAQARSLGRANLKFQPLGDSETHQLAHRINRVLTRKEKTGFVQSLIDSWRDLRGENTLEFDSNYKAEGKKFGFELSLTQKDAPTRVVRIGPLIFITASLDIERDKAALGSLYSRHAGNILFTPRSVDGTANRKMPLSAYTRSTIVAMLANAEKFNNAEVADLGAGDGILSRVALRLGAKRVNLVERENDFLVSAEYFLRSDGWKEEKFHLIEADLTRPDFESRAAQLALKKSADIVLANIGPWLDFYGNANHHVLNDIPNWTAMKLLINGGYFLPDIEHSRSNEPTYTQGISFHLEMDFLRKFGLQVRPVYFDMDPGESKQDRVGILIAEKTAQASVSNIPLPARSLTEGASLGEDTRKIRWIDEAAAQHLADRIRTDLHGAHQGVFRVGPLVFVNMVRPEFSTYATHMLEEDVPKLYPLFEDELKEKLGALYTEYERNIFLVNPSLFIQADTVMPLSLYSQGTIEQMLANADAFRDAVVVDLGSGDGLLARVALRLGARQVILAEMDDHFQRLAKIYLNWDGWSSDNFLPYAGNFTSSEFDRLIREKDLHDKITAALIDIGPWGVYKDANQKAVEIASALPGVSLLINGGYYYTDGFEIGGRQDHSRQLESMRRFLRSEGFSATQHEFQTTGILVGTRNGAGVQANSQGASLGAADVYGELVNVWEFEAKGGVEEKLERTANQIAKAGDDAVETMRQFKQYADKIGLKVRELEEGERKRLLTVIGKVSVKNGEVYERFQKVIQEIESRFVVQVEKLKQNEKVRIFTAAWATGKNLDIFKKLITKIEELFGIRQEDLAGLERGEKIRLITAAYEVSLSKEKGLEIFERTVRKIEELFGIRQEDLAGLERGEKIRLITAAYNVSLSKEKGLEIFERVLEEKRREYLEGAWSNFSGGLKVTLVMDAYFEKHAYGLWKDELQEEALPEPVTGSSLGAAEKFAGGIYPFWMYKLDDYDEIIAAKFPEEEAAPQSSQYDGFSVSIKTADYFDEKAERRLREDNRRAVSIVLEPSDGQDEIQVMDRLIRVPVQKGGEAKAIESFLSGEHYSRILLPLARKLYEKPDEPVTQAAVHSRIAVMASPELLAQINSILVQKLEAPSFDELAKQKISREKFNRYALEHAQLLALAEGRLGDPLIKPLKDNLDLNRTTGRFFFKQDSLADRIDALENVLKISREILAAA